MPITLLVFEDNDLLRESLSSLVALNSDFRLAAAYPNVMQAREQIAKHNPDVVLMDIDMPGRTGIEALKEIRTFNSSLPIIMLTVFDDNVHVLEAIKAGASGYLLKKHISTKLFESITEVLEGGAPMSPSIARMVITNMQRPSENPYQLTSREKEILTALSSGNSYKMIAAQFAISIDTVRTHIKKIYEKLQVHSQTEAVSKAINEKIV
ncbi:MAG TPA: response regulator transcription factor [Cyclobacteriaceae bacterium]|jgi:DNA-binding NarL/FixJ family response regulator|nr:response regulator transcription factor [Cytophagales bacterium]HMR57466.1 response regulator transcription factor [Cyclobacteriaceae bacterium]HNT49701.1 response regulator transcription factor [Cyclobacteriaceae bacterium]HRE66588.1 response regulator transcription factor [Cyclobacteriaceae bacterium]HRF31878.1 response regulator transcription factor [Cyclobacteriaceae bacterium]